MGWGRVFFFGQSISSSVIQLRRFTNEEEFKASVDDKSSKEIEKWDIENGEREGGFDLRKKEKKTRNKYKNRLVRKSICQFQVFGRGSKFLKTRHIIAERQSKGERTNDNARTRFQFNNKKNTNENSVNKSTSCECALFKPTWKPHRDHLPKTEE